MAPGVVLPISIHWRMLFCGIRNKNIRNGPFLNNLFFVKKDHTPCGQHTVSGTFRKILWRAGHPFLWRKGNRPQTPRSKAYLCLSCFRSHGNRDWTCTTGCVPFPHISGTAHSNPLKICKVDR